MGNDSPVVTDEAWDKGRTNFDSFTVITKCWVYTYPGDVAKDTAKLASLLYKHIDTLPWTGKWPNWKVKAVPETEEDLDTTSTVDGRVFAPLVVHFTTTAGGRDNLTQRSVCHQYFDMVVETLRVILHHAKGKYREPLGPNKQITSWEAGAEWGYSRDFALYSAKTTANSGMPAQTIGAVIMELTSIQSNNGFCKDESHDDCGPEAVLECVEQLFALHAEAWDLFCEHQQHVSQHLEKGRVNQIQEHVQKTIDYALNVNRILEALISLFEKHIGLDGTLANRPLIVRAWKRLTGGTFSTIGLKGPAVERLKADIRTEFNTFRLTSKTVKGHLTLCDENERAQLKAAINSAQAGSKEQTHLPSKFGVNANRIGDKSMHSQALQKAVKKYISAHAYTVEQINILREALDREFAEKGDKLFTKKKVRKARQPAGHNCLVARAKLQEKMKEMEGEWSDSDSASSLNEKQ
ncbi:hypothetical protein QBC35DRAFT_239374 [Podospora australis]|uniref:Uncharacterized protein n=1 Tax=Podospora australis TaxID=1536484 RepID=A0AAN6WTH4_9PEZI|nr:hypothetical protein QBC35DRAFT_239374 [Podospora australis]